MEKNWGIERTAIVALQPAFADLLWRNFLRLSSVRFVEKSFEGRYSRVILRKRKEGNLAGLWGGGQLAGLTESRTFSSSQLAIWTH